MARSRVVALIAMLGCVVTLVVGCKSSIVDVFSDAESPKVCNALNVECIPITDFSPNDYRGFPMSNFSFEFGNQETLHRSSKFGGISWTEDRRAPIFIRVFWFTKIGWERPRNKIDTHPIGQIVSGSSAEIFDFNFDTKLISEIGIPVYLRSRHQNIGSELPFGGVLHGLYGFDCSVGAGLGGIGTDGIRYGLRDDSFERAQTYKYGPSRENGQGPVDPQFRRESLQNVPPDFLPDALRFLLGWSAVGVGGLLAYSTGCGCTYKRRWAWTAISIVCLLIGFASLLLPIGW